MLEDVEMELLALAWRTANEMNVVNPVAGEGWPSAQRDLERVLGTQACKSTFSTFVIAVLTQTSWPIFTVDACASLLL